MVTPNGLWESVVDGISDWGYYLQSWLGSLSIDRYLDNIQLYHQKILDKNDTSKTEIDVIFENIGSIDIKYGNLLTLLEQEMEKYRNATHNLALIINPGSRRFTAAACLAWKARLRNTGVDAMMAVLKANIAASGADVNSMDREMLQEYVLIYEILHPEDGEKLDNLWEADQVLTDDDELKIKYIAYAAEEPYRTVYFKYLDQYKMGTIGGIFVEGAYYQSSTNKIYFEDGLKAFSQDARGPYTTWFHESGHATDSNAEEGSDFYCYNYQIYIEAFGREVTLPEAIYEDVYQNIRETIEDRAIEEEESIRVEMVLDTFRYGVDESQLTEVELKVREAVIKYYDSDLAGEVNEAACDVYGGVTNLEIGRNTGYGHRPSRYDSKENRLSDEEYQKAIDSYRYWYDAKGNATLAQSKELVAEYFSYHMTGNTAALESLEEHFPQTYRCWIKCF